MLCWQVQAAASGCSRSRPPTLKFAGGGISSQLSERVSAKYANRPWTPHGGTVEPPGGSSRLATSGLSDGQASFLSCGILLAFALGGGLRLWRARTER